MHPPWIASLNLFVCVHRSSVPRGGQRTQKGYDSFMESQELVLDVLQNNRVVLKKKVSEWEQLDAVASLIMDAVILSSGCKTWLVQ